MLELKNKVFEGKNKEELLNKALNELNASQDEVYYNVEETQQYVGSEINTLHQTIQNEFYSKNF